MLILSDSVTGMFFHFFTQKSFSREVGTWSILKNFQSPTQPYKAWFPNFFH